MNTSIVTTCIYIYIYIFELVFLIMITTVIPLLIFACFVSKIETLMNRSRQEMHHGECGI